MTSTQADLGNYDIYILIDRSGSMENNDTPNGKTRWEYAQETTFALATHAEKFDDDGISVGFFGGNSVVVEDNIGPAKVNQIFSEHTPNGGTPTDQALATVFNDYFAQKAKGQVKPRIIQVVTDGLPDDKNAVAQLIINTANKLDRKEELAVQFIQVGSDKSATSYLKSLDDDLQKLGGAKFDIVDAITVDDASNLSPVDLLLKALND